LNGFWTVFGVQSFSFGGFWSPTLQLWTVFGVQRFSFGRFLESNALALGGFLESIKKLTCQDYFLTV
jgi:hypothetical protein